MSIIRAKISWKEKALMENNKKDFVENYLRMKLSNARVDLTKAEKKLRKCSRKMTPYKAKEIKTEVTRLETLTEIYKLEKENAGE